MYLLDDIWKMANELMIESEIWEHNLNTSALYELSTESLANPKQLIIIFNLSFLIEFINL